jgi:hypothetical protein
VVLQQRVSLQPPQAAAALAPAPQRQSHQQPTGLVGDSGQQVDAMDVDPEAQDAEVQQQQQREQEQQLKQSAAMFTQLHLSFLQQLVPAVHEG